MRYSSLLATLTFILAFVAVASPQTLSAATSSVSIADFAFAPQTLNVTVGTTVTWTNNGIYPHTTTSDTGVWDSGPMSTPGQTFSYTFNAPGSYPYRCTYHAAFYGMVGTVNVLAGEATATPVATETPAATATATKTPLPFVTPAPAGVQVFYPAGWNVVAGPAGTTFSQASSILYTFQGDVYTFAPNTQGVTEGWGYWANFPSDTMVTLTGAGSASYSTTLGPGQWRLVGNPSGTKSALVAADVIYTYTATSGFFLYRGSAIVEVGRGAWVRSNEGGTVTITAFDPTPTPTPAPTSTPTQTPTPAATWTPTPTPTRTATPTWTPGTIGGGY